jgi:transmembrane sensor
LENYPFYTAEDFIHDERFRAWMLSDHVEGDDFWQDFQQRYPERKIFLEAAQALFLALHESQSFPTVEQGERMQAGIDKETRDPFLLESRGYEKAQHQPSAVMRPLWKWLAVAAAVLLVVGLGWITLWKAIRQPATYSGHLSESVLTLQEKINDSDQLQKIPLSDGSRIVLYPGSRIRYASPFAGAKREVFLSGKGYFEVVKDDTHPFVVFANQLVTQVVGTSFTIDASTGNDSPSVEVRTGKVKVFTLDKYRDSEQGQPEEMVLLTANQQVRYDIVKNSFDMGYVSRPTIIKKPEAYPDFYFKNTAVADVFKAMEDSYGVKIEFNETRLKDCRITVPLGGEPLFRKLDIVCQTIGATYEVWGTRIVVSGKGCQ